MQPKEKPSQEELLALAEHAFGDPGEVFERTWPDDDDEIEEPIFEN